MAEGDSYTTYSCELCDEHQSDEMVCCDLCSKWFHFTCVNIVSIGVDDEWVCPLCQNEINKRSSTFKQPIVTAQQLTESIQQSSSTPHRTESQNQTRNPDLSTTDFEGFTPVHDIRRVPVPSHSWMHSQRLDNNQATGLRLVQSYVYTRIGRHDDQNQPHLPMGPARMKFTNQFHKSNMNATNQFNSNVRPAFRPPYMNVEDYSTWHQNLNPSHSQQMYAASNLSRNSAQRIRSVNLENASIYSNYPSSGRSVESTMSQTVSSRRQQIELAKIEEEREFQERRDNEYLRQKYRVLLDECERSIVSKRTDRSQYTEDWLKRNNRSKSYLPDTNNDQRHEPDASHVKRFEKRLDEVQFESTSPLQRKDLIGKCTDDQNQHFWEKPTSQSVPTIPQPNSSDPIPNSSSTNPPLNPFVSNLCFGTTKSNDQIVPSKAQIAARHVVSKDLPIFYGKPEDWPMFISRFNNSTKICGFSNQENLDRLQRCLKGNALDAVRNRMLTDESVPDIIETLRMLFGRPDLIINSMIQTIRQEPAPKPDKLNTLVDFALKVGNLSSLMTQCGLESHLSNPIVMKELVDKLPTNIKIEWARFIQHNENPNLATLGKWLHQLAEMVSSVTEPTIAKLPEKKIENKFESKSKQTNNTSNVNNRVNVHQETGDQKDREESGKDGRCRICQKSCKKVDDCPVFISFDVSRRWKEIYDHHLCRKCLGRHGTVCNQDKKCGVEGCIYKHHPLLHDKKKHSKQLNSTTLVASTNIHSTYDRRVLSKIIPVDIHSGKMTVETFAYLDDGSDLTIVNKSLIERLGVKGTPEPMCLLWTGDVHRNENNSLRVTFNISGSDRSKLYCLNDVRTVEDLGLRPQTIIKDELVKRFRYLKDVPIVDYTNALPELLIGSDNVSLIAQLKIVEGKYNQPIAFQTRLGWTVNGDLFNRSKTSTEFDVNPHGTMCPYSVIEYDELHQQVKDFFTLENLGVQKNYTLNSKEDEKALELLEKHTKRIGNQFETCLLWRYEKFDMPDSYTMAYKRLQCLEKHKPEWIKVINETIVDYERKGYISKLDKEMVNSKSRVWYLPIFAVSHPKKPERIRTVFDAAAMVRGVSLNSMLLKGPDQLAGLTDILRRFREKRFAITGDIKEMFLQVKIRDEDKQAQRFIWRNGIQSNEPDQYVMNVMTFGAKCSPSAAQFVKNLNASKFEDKYSRAVEAIVKNHYVDDWLDGADDEKSLETLINQVIQIHSHGGFEIRNFLSNSIDIKRRFGEQQDTGKNLNLEINHGTERVLGMWWDTANDKFTFSLKYFKIDKDIMNQVRSPTKREVLKILMTVFDPLGFLSHYLIHLKILLQEVWKSKLNWDEEINTDSMKTSWTNWFELLPKVEEIAIPRLLSTQISPNASRSIQLHMFVDASEQAYSAVCYLRVENGNGVDCSLIGSKARVAPLKYLSIPRMELQSGVLGTRLLTSLCDGQTIKFDRRVIWTDSTTLLSWIRSDHRKYHQFVANRIGEILESTDVQEWRWISTKENVADEATKWTKAPSFHQSSRWFTGPSFLKLPPDQWPTQKSNIEPDTPEELRTVLAHKHFIIPVLIDVNRFSKWRHLHRSMAYVVRYVRNLKSKIQQKNLNNGPLTQEELSTSEKILIRQAQVESFTEEFINLKRIKGRQLPPERTMFIKKSSCIYKCSPYLDNDDVIRMRSRIGNAPNVVSDDTKRPIIMPKNHKITRLLVDDYHRIYHHRNDRTVHNEICQRFFIPQIRIVINSVRTGCQRCKNRRAKPIPPEMADLPMARLAIGFRAFTFIGIDYFGPLYVAVGRQRIKRWGMLITCLTVRAVNIEIVHTMNTESCIMGLRNHFNTYGPAEEVFCDNGTNLKGANNELKSLVAEVDQQKMALEFTSLSTKWNFNPPVSPHMGGSWERMVRCVKTCLFDILPERNPTDDALRNLILEVVNVVNSRPLSYVPLEHEGDEVLTPNHFIKGSSNGLKPMMEMNASGPILRSKWKENQRLADLFWTKFIKEFLPELTRRTKWFEPVEPLKIGDIVLMIDTANKRNSYPKARVIETVFGSNGQTRRIRVQKADGSAYWRSAHGLAKLDVLNEGLPAPPENHQTKGSVKNVNTEPEKTASALTAGTVENL